MALAHHRPLTDQVVEPMGNEEFSLGHVIRDLLRRDIEKWLVNPPDRLNDRSSQTISS